MAMVGAVNGICGRAGPQSLMNLADTVVLFVTFGCRCWVWRCCLAGISGFAVAVSWV